MVITRKKDELGPIWMVEEHYQIIKESISKYDENAVILEIGSYQGRSAIYMLDCNPKIHIFCLDMWKSQDILEKFKHNTKKYENRITIIKDLSVHASHHFSPQSVDFVYLDAHHKEEAVFDDLKNIHRIIKKTGVVLGDDWQKPSVVRAINKISKKYKILKTGEFTYLLSPLFVD
jgi:predicted O-methyltransferase YrrM